MALSVNESNAIENRFLAIERKLNEIQTALNKVPTKAQMKALLNVRQAEIEDLKTRVTTLEAAVTVLQS